ncbi:MAG TPA: ribose-phosphate diphosphokinase [Bacteroidales bacterium]|nr:ribose-phosphate diphosphokinase [Bacteroidales bacterium]
MISDRIMVFSGSGSRRLTSRICNYLQTEQGKSEVLHFSEGNTFVRINENVRGCHIYIVQSIVYPANDNLVELLFWIDAFKRASAESVTVIIPFFSYSKGDKKDEPRVSIRARVCADTIEVAGADRIVTMDLHSPQIQGFFRKPVDNLYALGVLCEKIKSLETKDYVIVSPDTGFAGQARKFASYLKAPVVIADKQRLRHDENAEITEIIGDVQGKTAIVVDDMIISGGTLKDVSEKLIQRGAIQVYAMATHGVLSPGSEKKLDDSPIKKLFITDTVENQPEKFSSKIEVVSVAAVFGEAIKRIHNKESLSDIFAVK